MQSYRSARQEDLHDVAAFITDRFWSLEQHEILARGLSRPKEILTSSTEAALPLFQNKGDITIHGVDCIEGVLVGIPAHKYTLLNILLSSLQSSRLLGSLSRVDAAAIQANGALQNKIHDRKWFRRYSRNAYYINWIAVAKECKGKGVFRRLLTPVLERCEREGMDVVLETFTESNVPIYEHFGFELVETHRSRETTLVEYCMIHRHGKQTFIKGGSCT